MAHRALETRILGVGIGPKDNNNNNFDGLRRISSSLVRVHTLGYDEPAEPTDLKKGPQAPMGQLFCDLPPGHAPSGHVPGSVIPDADN